MNLRCVFLLSLLAGLGAPVAAADKPAAPVSPKVTFQIVNMDPATPLALQPGNTVYLDIQYDSNVPVRITALPYYKGKEVTAEVSSSHLNPPGKGDVLASFTLDQEGAVDEVHLTASLEDGGTVISEDQAATFNWDDKAADHQPAAWVEPMREKELHRLYGETDHSESLSSPGNIGALLMTLLIIAAVLAGFVWSVRNSVAPRTK